MTKERPAGAGAHHAHEHHGPSERGQRKGRRLIDKVRLLGAHEEPASYWELFSDLLMVAAASSLAEVLEEDPTFVGGYLPFSLMYLLFVNGWWLYTHHYTARFDDSSLLHSLILFFYYLGMGGTIVNAQLECHVAFSISALFQRLAFLALFVPVACHVPGTKYFVRALGAWVALSSFMFLASALAHSNFYGQLEAELNHELNQELNHELEAEINHELEAEINHELEAEMNGEVEGKVDGAANGELSWFVLWWILAGIWEFTMESGMVVLLPGDKLIPINIEHTKERLGVLVLVMLGESVITSTISYKSYAAEGLHGGRYYATLTLSFLLIFMFTLLYFHMQPAPKDHALRRSRFAGVALILLNKLLGLSLLTIGACVKLSVGFVVADKPLSPFVANALRCSVGSSLFLLLGMRLCHYGGKIPRPSDPPHVARLFYAWWAAFALACVLPFVMPAIFEPTWAMAWPSGLLLLLCIVESWFSHILELHLPSEESEPLHSSERTNLYDSFAVSPIS